MTRSPIWILLVAGALPGCRNPTGCNEDRQVIEVHYDYLLTPAQNAIDSSRVQALRMDGYDCQRELEQAFVHTSGIRWTCTKCR